MNVALIFAGGTGQRMNSKTLPKQFLELYGKPIIIYTLEYFEKHKNIDEIVVVCIEPWIDFLQSLLEKFAIKKVRSVIPGGSTGQESIYLGLHYLRKKFQEDTVVLIHDGVRPLINEELITRNIESVLTKGNAVTVARAVDTIALEGEDDTLERIYDRSKVVHAKAPQSFFLSDIYGAHERAIAENKKDFIDSASMMKYYGQTLHMVEGSSENIKITMPIDFYIFRAIVDTRENLQIFG